MYTSLLEDTWPKKKAAQRKDNSVPCSSYLTTKEEEKTTKSPFTYVFKQGKIPPNLNKLDQLLVKKDHLPLISSSSWLRYKDIRVN